ncbi:MAG: cell wall hydrolase, partial [Faecalibacillus sp.]
QFDGVGTPLFEEPVSQNEKSLALRCINGYRNEPATNALWFKNPGTNVSCPETFYGRLSGRYKQHCFYNPGLKDNCDL